MKEQFEIDRSTGIRLRNIDALRSSFGLVQREVAIAPLPPLAPTLGIEIEVMWSQRFPDFATEWLQDEKPANFSAKKLERFNEACKKLEASQKDKYRLTEKFGIPKGRDGFWEFAHAPTKHPEVLVAEVTTLYEAGLLPEGNEYSLHVTIGGVEFGKNAYMLTMMLEMQDGTTPERIKGEQTKKAWSRLGEAGIKKRRPEELIGDEVGFEIRTLSLRSANQLESILVGASELGALVNCAAQSPHSKEALVWSAMCKETEELFAAHGLDAKKRWPEPHIAPDLWQKYADFLASVGS